MQSLGQAISNTIRRHRLLAHGDRVIVAVSGGPDSVCLLLALIEIAPAMKLDIAAAHVNHQLRAGESEADEDFVRHLCEKLGVPLDVTSFDTKTAAGRAGENLEDYARKLRYGFLFEVAEKRESKVATGHTLDDQGETFLMKLFRGAGPAGLSGIYPLRVNWLGPGAQTPVTIIRPLLESTRKQVLDYLTEREQAYRLDATNLDISYDRNWVRHQLIPLIQERVNPKLLDTIGRTARLFSEIESYLNRQGRKAFEMCRSSEDAASGIALEIEGLKRLHVALQKEAVRHALREQRGDLHNFTLTHIEDVLGLLERPSGKEIHLPQGIRAAREFDRIRFSHESSPPPFSYELTIPGEVQIRELGKVVTARHANQQQKDEKGVFITWVGKTLQVRNRRPGDRYRLCPGSRDRKLKEVLQRRRIPRSRRDKLLLIQAGDELAWVEGLPVNPRYRVRDEAEPTVEIEIRDETSSQQRPLKERDR